jgi:hypothetical protein
MKRLTRLVILSLCLATTSFACESYYEADDENSPRLPRNNLTKLNMSAINTTRIILEPILTVILPKDFPEQHSENPEAVTLYQEIHTKINTLKIQRLSVVGLLQSLDTGSDSASNSSPISRSPTLENPLGEDWIQTIINWLSPISNIDLTLFKTLASQQKPPTVNPVYITLLEEINALTTNNTSIMKDLKDLLWMIPPSSSNSPKSGAWTPQTGNPVIPKWSRLSEEEKEGIYNLLASSSDDNPLPTRDSLTQSEEEFSSTRASIGSNQDSDTDR